LDPAVDGDVVDPDPALGEQFLDIAVGEPKRRYQRTASTITSGGKQKPANTDRVAGRVTMAGSHAGSLAARTRPQQMQQRAQQCLGSGYNSAGRAMHSPSGRETSLRRGWASGAKGIMGELPEYVDGLPNLCGSE
jgi:hypothetical protein